MLVVSQTKLWSKYTAYMIKVTCRTFGPFDMDNVNGPHCARQPYLFTSSSSCEVCKIGGERGDTGSEGGIGCNEVGEHHFLLCCCIGKVVKVSFKLSIGSRRKEDWGGVNGGIHVSHRF